MLQARYALAYLLALAGCSRPSQPAQAPVAEATVETVTQEPMESNASEPGETGLERTAKADLASLVDQEVTLTGTLDNRGKLRGKLLTELGHLYLFDIQGRWPPHGTRIVVTGILRYEPPKPADEQEDVTVASKPNNYYFIKSPTIVVEE
jgi:hypothetical protein